MENRLCLLGFSGSVLSLIFNTLHERKWTDPVLIIENVKAGDDISFHSGVPHERKWHTAYHRKKGDVFSFSVMKPSIKRAVFEFFESGFAIGRDSYHSLYHPSLIHATTSLLGKGVYIEPACVVSPYANLGFGVTISRGCTVGHHTVIGDFATLNPGVHLAGHCHIGSGSAIGIGSVVFDHVTIGNNCVIGGGSVVNKNLPDGVLAFGNPCKVIRDIH